MIVTQVLNIATQTWSVVDPTRSTAALGHVLPGEVMKSGRSVDPDLAVIPSVATTYVPRHDPSVTRMAGKLPP